MNARELAFLALYNSLKETAFIEDTLKPYRASLKPEDFHLAERIAYGACQRRITLDYVAKKLTSQGHLSLKVKERALLWTALYQAYFMDKIPLFAIGDETGKIAKKYFHTHFQKFLNALIRKCSEIEKELPQGENLSALSIRYSYPPYLIEKLKKSYPEKMETILKSGNEPAQVMARIRKTGEFIKVEKGQVEQIASSSKYYIQDLTPFKLLQEMSSWILRPQKILDLCASPGGKLLAIHDLFPDAELFANDVSVEKIEAIQENLKKYQFFAGLRVGKGEEYPEEESFDLILLDVPCSNTGVMNKRAEARFRVNEKHLQALHVTQAHLLHHALKLLKPEGALFYMTCSILTEENEAMVKAYEPVFQKTYVQSLGGSDGGFGAIIRKKNSTNHRSRL